MQRSVRYLDERSYTPPLTLQNIDVIELETPQAVPHTGVDVLRCDARSVLAICISTSRGRPTLRLMPYWLTKPLLSASCALRMTSPPLGLTTAPNCEASVQLVNQSNASRTTCLSHDNDLLTREVELLDRLPEDDLGLSMGVHLQDRTHQQSRSSVRISGLTFAVSNVVIPWSYLRMGIGIRNAIWHTSCIHTRT